MFKIETLRADEEAKTLKLSEYLFHEALKDTPESKARFHVKNDRGEDFDIVYWDNDEDIEPRDAYPAIRRITLMSRVFRKAVNLIRTFSVFSPLSWASFLPITA